MSSITPSSLQQSPKDRPWIMRTYAGHSDAKQTNALYKRNLKKGQTGLSIAFDLPTQMGYDPDHPLSVGEVGRVGVPVWNLEQMETVLKDLPLDQLNCSMTINATAAYIMACYIACADKQGIPRHQLTGTTQNDIVKEYLSRGTYIFPPSFSQRLSGDIIAFCVEELPKWNPINICSYHLQEAGAKPVDEIAFTLSSAIDMLNHLMQRPEITPQQFENIFGRISFFVNAGIRFINEICKLRAFKKMWSDIGENQYSISDPKKRHFRYGVQVNSLGLTKEQPENNVYRILLEMLGVVLSKDARARAVQLPAWNEALGLPRPFDQQWSLRLQQIVAYETDLLEYGDIFEGSHIIENMTAEIITHVKEEMQYIQSIGGTISAIESGYMKEKLVQSHLEKRHAIEAGDEKIVGVNCFHEGESSPLSQQNNDNVESVSADTDEKARESFMSFIKQRNAQNVAQALHNLTVAVQSNANIMPPTIEAVKAGVTVGEWANVLRDIYGEYRAATGLSMQMSTQRANKAKILIQKVDTLQTRIGKRPKIMIAKPGLDGHSNGAEQLALRARDCGLDVVYEGIRLSPEQIANSALEEGVHLLGISLLSGAHLALTEEIMKNMDALGLKHIPTVIGGIIPEKDYAILHQYGIKKIYTASQYDMYEIIADIIDIIDVNKGLYT